MHKVIDRSAQKVETAMRLAPISLKIKPYPRGRAPSDKITSLLPVSLSIHPTDIVPAKGYGHFQNGCGYSKPRWNPPKSFRKIEGMIAVGIDARSLSTQSISDINTRKIRCGSSLSPRSKRLSSPYAASRMRLKNCKNAQRFHSQLPPKSNVLAWR
jgi:hypothetical protein